MPVGAARDLQPFDTDAAWQKLPFCVVYQRRSEVVPDVHRDHYRLRQDIVSRVARGSGAVGIKLLTNGAGGELFYSIWYEYFHIMFPYHCVTSLIASTRDPSFFSEALSNFAYSVAQFFLL